MLTFIAIANVVMLLLELFLLREMRIFWLELKLYKAEIDLYAEELKDTI